MPSTTHASPLAVEKSKALDALYERAAEPTRRTIQTAAHFVRGSGNPEAAIVFVGEAPGLNEDQLQKPFVGRSGQILNGWLEAMGLERPDVFITNVVKCHPMKNPRTPQARGNDRPPTAAEIRLCWPILEEEIRIIQPAVIVTLGSPAAQTVLATKEKITQLRGRLHPFPPEPLVQVFPLYHPAALCHNPSLKPQVLEDLGRRRAVVEKAPSRKGADARAPR
jgi:DNA polymerase